MTLQISPEASILWFTGFSGAGKTTLANAVADWLREQNRAHIVLDGDLLRTGLCSDLGFSMADRQENIRRVGEVACLMRTAGLTVLVACISPRAADRDQVRAKTPPERFLEIHCACSITTCEARDVKGLYAKARAGLIADFTGISSHYEAPKAAELVLDTGTLSLTACRDAVTQALSLRPSSP